MKVVKPQRKPWITQTLEALALMAAFIIGLGLCSISDNLPVLDRHEPIVKSQRWLDEEHTQLEVTMVDGHTLIFTASQRKRVIE